LIRKGKGQIVAGQRAELALKIEEVEAERAKKRMEVGRPKEGVERIPQDTGKARDKAAARPSSKLSSFLLSTSFSQVVNPRETRQFFRAPLTTCARLAACY
jgi:hypothetical protein